MFASKKMCTHIQIHVLRDHGVKTKRLQRRAPAQATGQRYKAVATHGTRTIVACVRARSGRGRTADYILRDHKLRDHSAREMHTYYY